MGNTEFGPLETGAIGGKTDEVEVVTPCDIWKNNYVLGSWFRAPFMGYTEIMFQMIRGIFRILKWSYCSIFLDISGDIPNL